jgi:hypothetical protein
MRARGRGQEVHGQQTQQSDAKQGLSLFRLSTRYNSRYIVGLTISDILTK